MCACVRVVVRVRTCACVCGCGRRCVHFFWLFACDTFQLAASFRKPCKHWKLTFVVGCLLAEQFASCWPYFGKHHVSVVYTLHCCCLFPFLSTTHCWCVSVCLGTLSYGQYCLNVGYIRHNGVLFQHHSMTL